MVAEGKLRVSCARFELSQEGVCNMLKLRLSTRLFVALAVTAIAASNAWAQGAPAVVTQTKTITAKVQAVFPDRRSVTLVGADGQPQSIFVGPDVRLDRIRAGDTVHVTYVQGTAAQMAKGGTTVSDPAAANFAYKNPAGANPGGGAGSSVTVTVTILGVNPGTNTVKFQQADGSQHVIEVKSPQMQDFIKTLKPGDKVNVTYTESVAINVTPG
jgi:hypothetical protein